MGGLRDRINYYGQLTMSVSNFIVNTAGVNKVKSSDSLRPPSCLYLFVHSADHH